MARRQSAAAAPQPPTPLASKRLPGGDLRDEGGRRIRGINPLRDANELPYAIYYNQYGEAMELPADGPLLQAYVAQGFTLVPPAHPKKKPVGLAGTGVDLDQSSEEYRLLWAAGFRRPGWNPPPAASVQMASGSVPTITYYSAKGTQVEGLADPESMKQYLAMGLSLDPPEERTGAQKE